MVRYTTLRSNRINKSGRETQKERRTLKIIGHTEEKSERNKIKILLRLERSYAIIEIETPFYHVSITFFAMSIDRNDNNGMIHPDVFQQSQPSSEHADFAYSSKLHLRKPYSYSFY